MIQALTINVKKLAFSFHSTRKTAGNAFTMQSKYTSAPSLIASALRDAPKTIRVSGKSENTSTFLT